MRVSCASLSPVVQMTAGMPVRSAKSSTASTAGATEKSIKTSALSLVSFEKSA